MTHGFFILSLIWFLRGFDITYKRTVCVTDFNYFISYLQPNDGTF